MIEKYSIWFWAVSVPFPTKCAHFQKSKAFHHSCLLISMLWSQCLKLIRVCHSFVKCLMAPFKVSAFYEKLGHSPLDISRTTSKCYDILISTVPRTYQYHNVNFQYWGIITYINGVTMNE